MKKSTIILTIIWIGVILVPCAIYLNNRRIQRENEAIKVRDQYQLLRHALIRGDFADALKTYFTPLYKSGAGTNVNGYVKPYRFITDGEYALHPMANIKFRGDLAELYLGRPNAPDVVIELQKISGQWFFNGEIIPIVD